MTAGVYDYTDDPAFLARYERDPSLPFGPQDAIRVIERHAPAFAPGTDVQYSDSNYVLLGLIVEKLTGRHLGDVIGRGILDPLDLAQTSYPRAPTIPMPFAHGYFKENGSLRDVTLSNPEAGAGAGAMISTLGDLRIWARALATGTLLDAATQKQRLKTVPLSNGGPIQLGYGLGIIDLNGFLGHNGAILGYGSAMFYLPIAGATFVVVGNNNDLLHRPHGRLRPAGLLPLSEAVPQRPLNAGLMTGSFSSCRCRSESATR